MAEQTTKTIKTKILLRYDVLNNWIEANPELKKGEVAIVAIPTDNKALNVNGTTPPQILFKVGDGTSKFNDLPYASGKAADVYSWAKEAKLSIAKDGKGNVVSGIEWDAAANNGKGGIKFTTASVATSGELEDVKDRLDAIEGTGEKSRITLLEEGLAATNKVITDNSAAWADNTTYTFSQNGKSFTVTPSEGEGKTITFDYLTADEIATKIAAYGYKNEADVKAIVESYKYATAESLKDYYTKDEIDKKGFLTEHQSLANYYNKTEVDGLVSPKADKSYVDEKLAKKVDSTTYSGKISSIEGRLDVVEGKDGIAGIKESIGDIQLDIEELDVKFEDYYTATQVDGFLGGKADKAELASYETVANADLVRGRVSTLEGHFAEGGRVTEAESKISTLEGAVSTIMNGTNADKIDSLNDLIEWADTHGGEVTKIKEDIEANATAIENLTSSKADKKDLASYYTIDQVNGMIQPLEQSIDEAHNKFAKYATIESVDSKTKALSESISAVDGKLVNYETVAEADKVRGRVSTLEGKVTTLEETTIPTLATKAEVNAVSDAVKAINETTIPTLATKAEVQVERERIDSIVNTTIPTLATKTEVAGVEEKVAGVEEKVAGVEEKVDGVIADYLKASDKKALEDSIATKQDIISDLANIRAGAAAGATAVQPSAITDMLTKTEAEGIYETKENVTAVSNRVKVVEDNFADWAIIWDCGGASNN